MGIGTEFTQGTEIKTFKLQGKQTQGSLQCSVYTARIFT